jgi:hypothetical protein
MRTVTLESKADIQVGKDRQLVNTLKREAVDLENIFPVVNIGGTKCHFQGCALIPVVPVFNSNIKPVEVREAPAV